MTKRKLNESPRDYNYKRQRKEKYLKWKSILVIQKFWRLNKNKRLRNKVFEIVKNCETPWHDLIIEKDFSNYKFLKEKNLNFIIVDLLCRIEDKLYKFKFEDFKLLVNFLELCKFDIVKLLNTRNKDYELYPVEVVTIFSKKGNTLYQLKDKINYLVSKGVDLNFGIKTKCWSLFHSLFTTYFEDNYDGKDKFKKIVSFLIESGATELNLLHGSVVKGTPLDMLDFDNDNDNDKLIKTKDGKKLYEFLMKKGFKSGYDLD